MENDLSMSTEKGDIIVGADVTATQGSVAMQAGEGTIYINESIDTGFRRHFLIRGLIKRFVHIQAAEPVADADTVDPCLRVDHRFMPFFLRTADDLFRYRLLHDHIAGVGAVPDLPCDHASVTGRKIQVHGRKPVGSKAFSLRLQE